MYLVCILSSVIFHVMKFYFDCLQNIFKEREKNVNFKVILTSLLGIENTVQWLNTNVQRVKKPTIGIKQAIY